MALDDRTAQAQLTPGMRRELLRAFADRMLRKITTMDDPEDMPGVERAVRVAAVIERVYSRCDRAERQIRIEAPDLFKAEAESATQQSAAIKARVTLANKLEWEDKRRRELGSWWDAAQNATQTPRPTSPAPASHKAPDVHPEMPPDTASKTEDATYTDYTDDILEARADLTKTKSPDPRLTEPGDTEPSGPARDTKPPPPS